MGYLSDGRLLALTDRGRSVCCWRLGDAAPEELSVFAGEYRAVVGFAIARHEPWVALWHRYGLIRAWDTVTWKVRHTFRAPVRLHGTLAFTPAGDELLAVSDIRTRLIGSSLKRWRLPSGEARTSIPITSAVRVVSVSPDGDWLATGSGDSRDVILWDLRTGRQKGLGGWMSRVLEQMGLAKASEQSGELVNRTRIRDVAFSPDGAWLATATGWTATLWPFEGTSPKPGAEPIDLRGHGRLVDSVAFSPDGRTMATGSRDGTVKVWDLPEARERASYHWDIGKLYRVAFSPDGSTVAASGDGKVVVWDAD